MEKSKINDFRDLIAWQKGHSLVLDIYKITKIFPKEEKFGIIDQMRRCAVSVTSNIAEGFSRKSPKEKIQFYHISLGSITELQNQLIISRDVGYITSETCDGIFKSCSDTQKLIRGLLKYLETSA
jgi:four helix bundle protein